MTEPVHLTGLGLVLSYVQGMHLVLLPIMSGHKSMLEQVTEIEYKWKRTWNNTEASQKCLTV